MSRNIQMVVDSHLCAQCGACVAVCPHTAVEMVESPAGLLVPCIDIGRCNDCGQCSKVCSGNGIAATEVGVDDPFFGSVRDAYAGYAADLTVRSQGQSGGLVSALLLYALEAGLIDSALVTSMPTNGSLRAVSSLAMTPTEILAAQGSKYCPTPLISALGTARSGERVAVVGLPCHLHAIHLLRRQGYPFADGVKWLIGLMCDRVMSYLSIDLMAEQAGLKLTEIREITYTKKATSEGRGEVRFVTEDGYAHLFPGRLRFRLKEYCTPPRCRLCFDKLNILADISVGDPWGLSPSHEGESVALVRSDHGAELIEAANAAGFIGLRSVDVSSVFTGQDVARRKQEVAAYSAIWVNRGYRLPQPLQAPAGRQVSVGGIKNRKHYLNKLTFSLLVAGSATREVALATVHRRIRRDQLLVRIRGLGRPAIVKRTVQFILGLPEKLTQNYRNSR